MHTRKPKNLADRFEWYAPVIEADPEAAKGQWAARHMPEAVRVHLDLGCGKAVWTSAAAQAAPDDLFIGFDNEEVCIAMGAKRVFVEDPTPNVILALADASNLDETIGDAEIDVLHLNFSTPCPKKKKSPDRLTYADKLMAYRRILAPEGRIELKTDSQPFFDYTLVQMKLAGYVVEWQTRDLHALAEGEPSPIDPNLVSAYEMRLVEKGAKVHALVAVPGPAPESWDQGEIPQSLMEYLPEDLDSMDYVPYGMEGAVTNFRNKRANAKKRQQRKEQ